MLGKNGELVAGGVDPSNLDYKGTHTFEMSQHSSTTLHPRKLVYLLLV